MNKCYSFYDTVNEGGDFRGLVIECLEGLPAGEQRCRHIKAGGCFANCPKGKLWNGGDGRLEFPVGNGLIKKASQGEVG